MKRPFDLLLHILLFGTLTVSTTGCFIIRNNFYTDPEKCYTEALEDKPFDAIIIPGFPHDSIKGWDRIVQGRIYWALFLYQKGITKNVIFSGSAVYTPYVESKVMALYAEQLGIPKEHIFVETKAEHSTENLYYSYALAQQQGFKTIALATDPVQSSFLVSYKRKFKLANLKFIPIIYDTLMVMNKTIPTIDARSAYVVDFVALPERESLYKRVRGTGGAKIKKLLKQQRKEARIERRRLKKEKRDVR
ncbi:MAG: hypothetical protein JWM14_3214 [Chitinophagaceae bacterium]|nr:hypothetical protein [Chitinophagaceae bacterium]